MTGRGILKTREGSPEVPEDWTEKKDTAKNLRYEHHRALLKEA